MFVGMYSIVNVVFDIDMGVGGKRWERVRWKGGMFEIAMGDGGGYGWGGVGKFVGEVQGGARMRLCVFSFHFASGMNW